MHSAWLKGLTGPAKEQRKQEILRHQNAFDDLKEVLEKNYRKRTSVRDYGEPGWEHRQIAANEYNAMLDDLLKLITLTKV